MYDARNFFTRNYFVYCRYNPAQVRFVKLIILVDEKNTTQYHQTANDGTR